MSIDTQRTHTSGDGEDPLLVIGLDDTDTLTSRGTGHLARAIAASLARDHRVLGVTRHQLLVDPRIPYTAKNSSAAILLERNSATDADDLVTWVATEVRERFHPGSDPGICVAVRVPRAIQSFGRRAQRAVVSQDEARGLADAHGVRLIGLAGSEQGVIGALAAVGLTATGDDGRYVAVGASRELCGLQPVPVVKAAGIADVRTLDGRPVREGLILADRLRPARRDAQPIAFVEWTTDRPEASGKRPIDLAHEGYWLPLKLD